MELAKPYLYQTQEIIYQCSRSITDVMPALFHDACRMLSCSTWTNKCDICANKIAYGEQYRWYEFVNINMCRSCGLYIKNYYCHATDHTRCQGLTAADLRALQITLDKCRTRSYNVLAHGIIAGIAIGQSLNEPKTQYRCSICTRIIHIGTYYMWMGNINKMIHHVNNLCNKCNKKTLARRDNMYRCGTTLIFATPHIGHGIFPSDIIMLIASIVHKLICQW